MKLTELLATFIISTQLLLAGQIGSPIELSTTRIEGVPTVIKTNGQVVVVGCSNGLVVLLNIEDPTQPKILWSGSAGLKVVDVAIAGQKALIVTENGIFRISLTDSALEMPTRIYDADCLGAVLSADILFAIDKREDLHILPRPETILPIGSDPTKKRPAFRPQTFASEDTQKEKVESGRKSFFVDVEGSGELTSAISVVENTLYVINKNGQMFTYSVDMNSKNIKKQFSLPGYMESKRMASGGRYLVLARADSGVDLSRANNGTLISHIDTRGDGWDYTITGNDTTKVPLETPGVAYDVSLSNNVLFIANGSRGLRIFDVSVPFSPREYAGYNTHGDTRCLSVHDNIVAVGDSANGVSILQASTSGVSFSEISFKPTRIAPDNPVNAIGRGRRVRLRINLGNSMENSVLSGFATLTSLNTDVAVTNGRVAYNNIPSGQNRWSGDDFEILVSEGSRKVANAGFRLRIQQNFDPQGPWDSYFSIPLNPVSLDTLLFDDDAHADSRGNGNHRVDPGEQIECLPYFGNRSTTKLLSVTALLTSPGGEVAILDNIPGVNTMIKSTQGVCYSFDSGVRFKSTYEDFVFQLKGKATGDFSTDFIVSAFIRSLGNVRATWSVGSIPWISGRPSFAGNAK